MATNKYEALCAGELCTTWVPPGGGVLVRGERGWLTYCPDDDPALGARRLTVDPEDRPHEAVVAFLHARLGEEEATAGAAWITEWRHWPPRSQNVVDGHDELVVTCPERGIADHIATWGPTAALENADSRRMVLDLYEDAQPGPAREGLLDAVRALAMAYRYHPDYDTAWTLRRPRS
ncbi:hypothetical protein DTL70_06785 [Streptomyces diacarni]|uniref:Uncharacterized protein n=1 Tax=Streptomyces diacarni TaxID=2800381 RepID=A0A367F9D9_9ACTN|nr:DUF6221 family protein [Streptomyces diacarni]RCG26297.1 hypothetical protein DTL70_06785 [Streptomyces diacarni]